MKLTPFPETVRAAILAAAFLWPVNAAASGQEGVAIGQLSADRQKKIRIAGTVRDEQNAIALPGIPVQVIGTDIVVYTDVDGRYVLDMPPGRYDVRVSMEGYQDKTIRVEAGPDANVVVDVGLSMARYSETVTVTGRALTADTSSAEAQLIERKQAQVITDNMGAQDMKANGDADAAAAMSRVTGLSVVDNQYVYVRGLGERYSNTTLAGSVLPTTEPDKKVVPLDLFPAGLIDSVQVAKSYVPDRPAEFAGGLVQIVPLKLPSRRVLDVSYGLSYFETATGDGIPLSPLGSRDWLGFDGGARNLPAGIPAQKIVRRGIYTPTVGYSPDEIAAFGRLFENRWRPVSRDGRPGQHWSAVFGNRFGRLGLIASVTHAYKEQFLDETRRFFRISEGSDLEAVSDYRIQSGTQKAQIGIVGNIAWQFTSNHRLSLENFYTHSGRDEGRTFEGLNTENLRYYRNDRLQFIEEGLMSNAVSGEHFLRGWANSRIDWRAGVARARRDEPDLREVLYESAALPPAAPRFVLADESQSGFRMFNALDDDTTDLGANWSVFGAASGRPMQLKFGVNYVERRRDFQSRRFRFIPVVLNKDGAAGANLSLEPEALYTAANIGTAFRFNEETRPVDAYSGTQSTTAAYGMTDLALTDRTRLVAGARIERFDQTVDTFDPFGLFERTVSSTIDTTDVFPAVNLVRTLSAASNLRVSYSATVNRPEFRELTPFEFTDVVGSRAVRGNPGLDRAIIQNVDARWELFPGGRDVLAASVFYKRFDRPIERVVIAGAQPIVTFQNADSARNVGVELEAGRQLLPLLFVSANYTFVDSRISLAPEQRTVQTSLERPLAGQSKHLLNAAGEFAARGFSSRVLFNFVGDRISDVGANEAPDVIEQGRGTLDLVFSQRIGGVAVRVTIENLTNQRYRFTQGREDQRLFSLGRTVAVSCGYSLF